MSTPLERNTHTIDATDQILGRLATEVATLLRGKHKPSYQPHIDGGDIVVVKNIAGMKVTGKKSEQKLYHRSTRYPGGIRTEQLKDLMEDNPAEVLRRAVRGMLPDNKLRPDMLKRLTIS